MDVGWKMNEPFRYHRLDAQNNEIRLLFVLPPTVEDPDTLHCSLDHFSLNYHLIYHALSYTWIDDPSESQTYLDIVVNNARLPVGQNLGAALRARRDHKHSTVPVWVDAICINQRDVHERNHQVLRMHEIYSKASLVTVWLGPERDESGKAIQFIRTINEQAENAGSWLKESIVSRKHSSEWVALDRLLNRSWWGRIWIVQEMVAAKEAIFFCGRHSLDPLDFSGCLELFIEHQVIYRPLLSEYEGIVLPHRLFSCTGSYLYPGIWEDSSLIRAIYNTGMALSSDPRDKIYAILNLSNEGKKMVPQPDYELSVLEVYKQVVVSAVKQTGLLDILSLAGIGSPVYPRQLDIKMPTWVPDFSYRSAPGINCMTAPATVVYADQDSDAIVSFDDAFENLTARGFIVDEIDGLAHIIGDRGDRISHSDQRLHQSTSQASIDGSLGAIEAIKAISVSLLANLIAGEDYFPAALNHFIQQCLAPVQESSAYPSSTSTSPTFENWYRLNYSFIIFGRSIRQWAVEYPPGSLPTSKLDGDFFDYLSELHWLSRRLMSTKSGNVGLGPNTSKPGDKVCIILGCSTPLLLRPVGGQFELIGECYLHWFMDGKGMFGLKRGEYALQDFEIR